MPEVEIYNLDIGAQRATNGWDEIDVGPFSVRLVDEYEERAARLYQPAKARVSFTGPVDALEKSVSRSESTGGGWVCTAVATIRYESDQSVLALSPIADAGVWDLCEILTFLTGRRVTIAELTERYNPNARRSPACAPIETLPAASVAWKNRSSFAESGLRYGLLTYNLTIGYRDMNVIAGQQNTAFNILVDEWPSEKIHVLEKPLNRKIPKRVRRALAEKVQAAVEEIEDHLFEGEKEAYQGILMGRALQGPYSLHGAAVQFLKYDVGVIPVDADETILRRVKFMNAVRNQMTHAGQLPALGGMDREVADRYGGVIINGVVPEINQLAIGRLFGMSTAGLGSASQRHDELFRFFTEGTWHGYPLELMGFDEWLNSPETLI